MKLFNPNKSIGGYFELELNKGEEYHKDAIALNAGRNCLEYILKVRKYSKVFIPFYTCDVILEPFKKTNTNYEFYSIDNNLAPRDIILRKNEALLYINYFGIKGNIVKKLAKDYKNLIIDNSQAFFEKPINNIDTFYSPRKFFGAPDGGYLYINKALDNKFKKDLSIDRFNHLLKRIDINSEAGYSDYIQTEKSLNNQPIKLMSNLTKRILQSINYKDAKLKRQKNFEYIHKRLKKYNELKIDSRIYAPMVYPFMYKKLNIREKLINNRIYIARYWDTVTKWVKGENNETELIRYLIPLPIDQRYNISEINTIIKLLKTIIYEH